MAKQDEMTPLELLALKDWRMIQASPDLYQAYRNTLQRVETEQQAIAHSDESGFNRKLSRMSQSEFQHRTTHNNWDDVK